MKQPDWVTNECSGGISCREIVRTAQDLLSGKVGVTEGIRKLASLSHEVRADQDPDFRVLIGIASQSDEFPIGESRSFWNEAALAIMDRQCSDFEAQFRKAAHEAATRLVEKYRDPDEDGQITSRKFGSDCRHSAGDLRVEPW